MPDSCESTGEGNRANRAEERKRRGSSEPRVGLEITHRAIYSCSTHSVTGGWVCKRDPGVSMPRAVNRQLLLRMKVEAWCRCPRTPRRQWLL